MKPKLSLIQGGRDDHSKYHVTHSLSHLTTEDRTITRHGMVFQLAERLHGEPEKHHAKHDYAVYGYYVCCVPLGDHWYDIYIAPGRKRLPACCGRIRKHCYTDERFIPTPEWNPELHDRSV